LLEKVSLGDEDRTIIEEVRAITPEPAL